MLGGSIGSALLVLVCATLAVIPNDIIFLDSVQAEIAPVLGDRLGKVNYRLPNNTVPISYSLRLTTHIHTQTTFAYEGEVAIRLIVLVQSRTITLHVRDLTVRTAHLAPANNADGEPVRLKRFTANHVNDHLTITLPWDAGDMAVGEEYILTMQFAGVHGTEDVGFFRKSYQMDDGSKRWIACTQFEPVHARATFPCYDEPELRAFFQLTIIHGSEYHAVSNMPVESTEDTQPGMITTKFAMTTVMFPLYTFAFVVSDFPVQSVANARGLVHRVFASYNAIRHTSFALQTQVKVLDALATYLQTPFELPKIDMVAIPELKSDSMGNWGLLIYSEHRLLIDENRSTTLDKELVVLTVAHELSHQWYGGLVTIEWWTYRWITEGMATMLQYYCADWVFPYWNARDTFVSKVVQETLLEDARQDTRPMTYRVEQTKRIRELADEVTSNKAAAVLYMLLNALTEKTFNEGMILNLKEKSYSADREENLFTALQRNVDSDRTLPSTLTVALVFSSWSHQSGFPLVSVTRNYSTGAVRLAQQRYFDRSDVPLSSTLWWIPYKHLTPSNTIPQNRTSWFGTRSATLWNTSVPATDWFLLNHSQTGFYRVLYDGRNYALLTAALLTDHRQFHTTTRSQLIDDAFELARSGRLGYDVVLDLIQYLCNETKYAPWASALRGIDMMARKFAGSPYYAQLSLHISRLVSHLYTIVGLTPGPMDSPDRSRARNAAIRLACRFGHPACLAHTRAALNDFLIKNITVHQDCREVILGNGLRSADRTQTQAMLQRAANERHPLDRARLLSTLAYGNDIDSYLLLSIQPDSPFVRRPNDRLDMFTKAVRTTAHGLRAGIAFFRAHTDDVVQLYGLHNANEALAELAAFVVGASLQEQFEDLLANATHVEKLHIDGARTLLGDTQKWVNRNGPVIEKWLLAHKVGEPTNGAAAMKYASTIVVVCFAFAYTIFK